MAEKINMKIYIIGRWMVEYLHSHNIFKNTLIFLFSIHNFCRNVKLFELLSIIVLFLKMFFFKYSTTVVGHMRST